MQQIFILFWQNVHVVRSGEQENHVKIPNPSHKVATKLVQMERSSAQAKTIAFSLKIVLSFQHVVMVILNTLHLMEWSTLCFIIALMLALKIASTRAGLSMRLPAIGAQEDELQHALIKSWSG